MSGKRVDSLMVGDRLMFGASLVTVSSVVVYATGELAMVRTREGAIWSEHPHTVHEVWEAAA